MSIRSLRSYTRGSIFTLKKIIFFEQSTYVLLVSPNRTIFELVTTLPLLPGPRTSFAKTIR